jgi:glycolate oxidase
VNKAVPPARRAIHVAHSARKGRMAPERSQAEKKHLITLRRGEAIAPDQRKKTNRRRSRVAIGAARRRGCSGPPKWARLTLRSLAMSHIAFPEPEPGILARRDQILAGLAALLPPGSLITDENERRPFETDALTAYRRLPLAVALPTSTQEVARILKYCGEAGVYVVPRGAGTSLAGGAIPQEDAIVLGLSRMSRILEVNLADRYARVEAGVTNLAISEAVAADGFFYAPDPSSQLACTIGGNIGMNSGGAHCLKYGVTTNNVLGVTLVTLDGEIVELGGAHLDAGGLDLLGLTIGSEGQLGIVTEAIVRLLRAAEGARPVLFGFDSAEAAGQCVAAIIGAGIIPVAIEYMDRLAIEICEGFAHAGYPLDVEAMLIVEVDGSEQEMTAQLNRINAIAKTHGVKVVRESMSAMESALIWKGRKSAFGATGRIADYICMDGTVPTGRLPEALKRTGEIVASYGLRVANVFHAGDGNMHPLVLYNVNDEAEQAKAEAAGADLLRLCVDLGGCLTGEHGVGIEKRDLMTHQFTPQELAQQMRVRAVFDPQWRLNPAKVFPLTGRVLA